MLLAPFANKLSRHNFVEFLKFMFPSFCVTEDSLWQRVDCIGNSTVFVFKTQLDMVLENMF